MAKKHKTVLIVEDSPTQALRLQKVLEKEGLKVLHAPNGRIGVSMAQRHTPDVIVLDIEMPEMNGFETCGQLKKNAQTAGIPVVILTCHDHVSMLLQGIDLGAIDFIPKDIFSENTLLETLRQLHILGGNGSQAAEE